MDRENKTLEIEFGGDVMNYIDSTREIPPLLIFHGTNDELVPFGQSCMLYNKLVQCNKTAAFYAIDNAHHGGREFWSNQVFDIIEDFVQFEVGGAYA